jgi:hypothetical protein
LACPEKQNSRCFPADSRCHHGRSSNNAAALIIIIMAATTSSLQRRVQQIQTCYDLLEVEGCQRKDLCCGCSNYFELPVKKKKQVDMGDCIYGCLRLADDLRKMFYDRSVMPLQSVGPKNVHYKRMYYLTSLLPLCHH